MDARQLRGQQIADTLRITRNGDEWTVPSQTGKGRYTVSMAGPYPTCTCPDYQEWANKCKHMRAVEYTVRRQENADGTTTETRTYTVTETTVRPTYKQDWPNYNKAQTREKEHFLEMLSGLCDGIRDTTPPRKGQKPIPFRDAVFACCYKVFSTFSTRRFMTDLRDAHEKGFIGTVPCYNSIINYFDHPAMSEILRALITESSLPLKAVEVDFACDSSGFMTSRFARWFDHKYGVVRQKHEWVKAHIMCGVKTNVVTAVEIHDKDASDPRLMPDLVNATAKNFKLNEVSADKVYGSLKNYGVIASHGATPFIAFKSVHTGAGGGLWAQMFHYFQFRREEFLRHYHKRSNVESTFSMIKAKFRDHVRSKTENASKNEVLAKILCHNIACLIHAVYELGIEPTFWGGGNRWAETAVAQRSSHD